MSDDAQAIWQEVRTVYGEAEAAIIQGLLEDSGIACRVDSMRVSQLPVAFGKMGELRILVREEDAARAEAILAESEGVPGTEG